MYRNFTIHQIFAVLSSRQGAGISGIKVHRITRVHNRILRTRFDDKLDQILDRDDITDITKYGKIEVVNRKYINNNKGSNED